MLLEVGAPVDANIVEDVACGSPAVSRGSRGGSQCSGAGSLDDVVKPETQHTRTNTTRTLTGVLNRLSSIVQTGVREIIHKRNSIMIINFRINLCLFFCRINICENSF